MAAEAQFLIQRLLSAQNPDGGWSYRTGISWAEPTAFGILAFRAQGDPSLKPALERATAWLLGQQKPCGGWSPNSAVAECTSVTSVATLALLPVASQLRPEVVDKALQWTANHVYRDELSLSLLLSRALNLPPAHAPGSVPWYPGTAGWVTPTALSLLLLLKAARERSRPDLYAIAAQSCSYLLQRRCADGGWNHGGSKTRSEDATSYPETTGLALLALRAALIAPPPNTVDLALHFVAKPESMEGLSWLQMALCKPHDPLPAPSHLPALRTTRDAALRLLALNALAGTNIFVSA